MSSPSSPSPSSPSPSSPSPSSPSPSSPSPSSPSPSSPSSPSPSPLGIKLGQAALLWFEGFREACCIHRVFILCLRSRKLLVRTGQCFLLNGFIYLGSIFVINSVVIPTLQWILPDQCPSIHSQEPCYFNGTLKLYSFLRYGLVQLLYILWCYPLYVFSFVLSSIWYIDIAKFGFAALGRVEPPDTEVSSQKEPLTSQRIVNMDKRSGLGGVVIGIGEQIYSVFLLITFSIEVYGTGFVPYVGRTLNFILLSWMYAYYSFEYKWNLSEISLKKRLEIFESNWAFFAGFGNPCVLSIFFFRPLVSYGVLAVLFPLFVLTATSSEADKAFAVQRRKQEGADSGRLPIFYAADALSTRILSLLSLESHAEGTDDKNL